MKLLIITQKININDDNLGFFHRWVEEFAKHCDVVTVICLQKGEYALPDNVKILSLGKEQNNFQFSNFNFQILKRLKYLKRFYQYIYDERDNYDVVFVHMNPEYILFGGLLWRLWGKRISLWYTHKSVDLKLRVAEKLAQKIFTASRESFRLASSKVEIVGHGIDTEYFTPHPEARDKNTFRIISTGRITRSKRLREMILAMADLRKIWSDDRRLVLDIIGGARMPEDLKYAAELKELIVKNNLSDAVRLLPPRPYAEMAAEYQKSDLLLNFSLTGSLDKAVLEAMSCGINILTSNEAFFSMLPAENILHDVDMDIVASRLLSLSIKKIPKDDLRAIVIINHNLKRLIGELLFSF
jgi:glycosyltransferase involved in cell wall biosynthesis